MQQSKPTKRRLQYAGGFRICDGGPANPQLRRRQIIPWRKAVRSFIAERVKAGDKDVIKMIEDLTCEIQTYSRRNYNEWANVTPLEKQQALFLWIIEQGQRKQKYKYTAADILAAGIAGDLWTTYGPDPQLRTPYARAAHIGRSVWFLLSPEWRDLERHHTNGSTTPYRLLLTKKVRMRSRYAAQQIEACIKKHAGWFITRHEGEILQRIQGRQLCSAL